MNDGGDFTRAVYVRLKRHSVDGRRQSEPAPPRSMSGMSSGRGRHMEFRSDHEKPPFIPATLDMPDVQGSAALRMCATAAITASRSLSSSSPAGGS